LEPGRQPARPGSSHNIIKTKRQGKSATASGAKPGTPNNVQRPETRSIRDAATAGGPGFAEALGKVVDAVETTENQANTAVSGMLNGTTDVHDAMIAMQRADLTLQFSVQIRNKLVQAYSEIMRMPV
jgi:flagellar hook-basal body complex protein FliE